MEDSIQDAHERGFISFQKEDFIKRAVENPENWSRIGLPLALSEIYRMDKVDKMLVEHQNLN